MAAYIERIEWTNKDGKTGHRYRARYRPLGGKKVISRSFATKGEARAWLDTERADIARGQWIDPSLARTTLREFVEREYQQTTVGLAPSTRARDASYLRTHILPAFGDWSLGEIDYVSAQAWVEGLTTQRAPATVVKAAQILGKVLTTAVRARRIQRNPMSEVRLPRVEESEDVFLTPAQVVQLADAMEEVAPRFCALVWLGCYAGPRIGELAALRWDDVDLLHRTVSLSHKVVEVSGLGMVEGPTKTKAGRRSVTIPKDVARRLDEHQRRFGRHATVFPSSRGCVLRPNQFRRREWAQAVELSGLDPAPTPHDMRHTAVSLWIAAGASDLEVAKWAGHRSVSFTKDHYAHLFPEHGEALAERLDGLIASATDRPAAQVKPIRRAR